MFVTTVRVHTRITSCADYSLFVRKWYVLALVITVVLRQAKVDQVQGGDVVMTDHYVLRFDVPVYQILRMQG